MRLIAAPWATGGELPEYFPFVESCAPSWVSLRGTVPDPLAADPRVALETGRLMGIHAQGFGKSPKSKGDLKPKPALGISQIGVKQ